MPVTKLIQRCFHTVPAHRKATQPLQLACLSGKMQSRPDPPVLQNGTGLPHTAPGLSAAWQPFAEQTRIPHSTQLFNLKAVYHIYFPRGCSFSFPLFAFPHTILDFALIKRWCSLYVHLRLTCDLSVATSGFDRVCQTSSYSRYPQKEPDFLHFESQMHNEGRAVLTIWPA